MTNVLKDNIPIAIFCYDRPIELKRLITTLKANVNSDKAEVYFFCDGAKDATKEENVLAVRKYVSNITGFKSVKYYFSEVNKGLAPSIIEGVTKMFRIYNKVIVLEDDLILSPNFISWMNQTLSLYENHKDVFSISGFCPSVIKFSKRYQYDGFFTHKAHSWGWATWKDRWEQVDWEVKDWEEFSTNKKKQKEFNTIGSEMSGLLFDQMNGKKSSWWVRFCYTQFKLGKYTLYPIYSKVINDGFTAEATHCNVYNRYRVDFDTTNRNDFILPGSVNEDTMLSKRFYSYYSLRSRILGKIKTIMMNKGLIKQYTINS